MAKQQIDDDIFTLKEEELGRHRSQLIQYILVSVFAVLVIGVALYMSWWLTVRRMEYQGSVGTEAAQQGEDGEEQAEQTNFWPSAQFPDIPEIAASVYDTRLSDHHAEISVPMAAADGFDAYVKNLADKGAQVYIDIPRLKVLSYKGTEIHLIKTSGRNGIELCAEPELAWNDPDYADFPLPQSGDLVSVADGTGERSRALTYRHMSANDAVQYVSRLSQSDWMIMGTLEPEDHIFSCSFRKDNMQIGVDYFASSYNVRIKLDFLS